MAGTTNTSNALYKNNSGLLSSTGMSTTSSSSSSDSSKSGAGAGWLSFINQIPGILGAVGNTVVGVKAAEAEKEKAKNTGFLNTIGLGGYSATNNSGGNGWVWILVGLLVVGVVIFFALRGKK